MLQVDICPYASDALEDAMRLAQTKSLNSYTFSDCLNFLNYVWSDIYNQICMIDSGYYSKTVRLTEKLTKLPKFVKNSIMVYSAQSQTDYNRYVYRQAGETDMMSSGTYRISGNDLWCPDAEHRKVFLEYCPQPMQIFFTHHNRDPKIYTETREVKRNSTYNLWKLVGQTFKLSSNTAMDLGLGRAFEKKMTGLHERFYPSKDSYTGISNGKIYYAVDKAIDVSSNLITSDDIENVSRWILLHRSYNSSQPFEDITDYIIRDPDENGQWQLKYISCDYPYIFCSYQHSVTGEWSSGFFDKNMEWTDYNPFQWVGRNDNVEYIECHYNDKTGLGVIVRDWNDIETKMLNIDKLPDIEGSVIYVENTFEYKGEDGTLTYFTPGYWFNRYNTDFNYEQVPEVEYLSRESLDVGDVIINHGSLKRWTGTDFEEIQSNKVKHVAQIETKPRVKELGWTPDTKLIYPAPEVYRYLVARLAEKFSALNESNIMGVQSELADARFAFQAFLKKDKSAWERMRNVNPASLGDWL